VIIAAALHFFIVLPINKLVEITNARANAEEAEKVGVTEDSANEEDLLREIRDLLKAQSPKKLIKQPLHK
jgi:large-conductance mechanosensitive channel